MVRTGFRILPECSAVFVCDHPHAVSLEMRFLKIFSKFRIFAEMCGAVKSWFRNVWLYQPELKIWPYMKMRLKALTHAHLLVTIILVTLPLSPSKALAS